MKSRAGFTLVEMLVVATIVALLAAAGLVSYASLNRNARNARRQADLEEVRAAMELYRIEVGSYPSGSFSSVLSQLQGNGFITNVDIEDPKNQSPYVYTIDTSSPFSQGCNVIKSYEMCARLEPGATWHCVCSP